VNLCSAVCSIPTGRVVESLSVSHAAVIILSQYFQHRSCVPLTLPSPAPVFCRPSPQVQHSKFSDPDPVPQTPNILAPTPNILAPTPYILAPTPYILAPTPYILAPTPYILAPTPNTLAPTPYILAPTPWPQHPTSWPQHPGPNTLAPTPYIPHPTLHTYILDSRPGPRTS
jgi:hypothetical protein